MVHYLLLKPFKKKIRSLRALCSLGLHRGIIVLSSLASAMRCEVERLDIKKALLYASLPAIDKIYIKLPTIAGIWNASGAILRFRMCPYGVHQTTSFWCEELSKSLMKMGIHRFFINYAIFISTESGPPVFFWSRSTTYLLSVTNLPFKESTCGLQIKSQSLTLGCAHILLKP